MGWPLCLRLTHSLRSPSFRWFLDLQLFEETEGLTLPRSVVAEGGRVACGLMSQVRKVVHWERGRVVVRWQDYPQHNKSGSNNDNGDGAHVVHDVGGVAKKSKCATCVDRRKWAYAQPEASTPAQTTQLVGRATAQHPD